LGIWSFLDFYLLRNPGFGKENNPVQGHSLFLRFPTPMCVFFFCRFITLAFNYSSWQY
jgi:hypothetical protein